MEKVYYEPDGRIIARILPDVKPVDYADRPFVICTSADYMEKQHVPAAYNSIEDALAAGDEDLITKEIVINTDSQTSLRVGMQTIDYWLAEKQESGYVHTDGLTYSSTARGRGFLLGKIQEMEFLSSNATDYPDINGMPHHYTFDEIKDVGIGLSKHIEELFVTSVGYKTTLSQAELSFSDMVNITGPLSIEVK